MATQKLLSRLLPLDDLPCQGRGGECHCSGVVQVEVAYLVGDRPAKKRRRLCQRCAVLWLARRIEDEGLLAVPGDVLEEVARVLPTPTVELLEAPPTEQMLVEHCTWRKSKKPPAKAGIKQKPKKLSKALSRSR